MGLQGTSSPQNCWLSSAVFATTRAFTYTGPPQYAPAVVTTPYQALVFLHSRFDSRARIYPPMMRNKN